MFFIARAQPPMLPPWLGATSTIRILSRAIGTPVSLQILKAGGSEYNAALPPHFNNPGKSVHPLLNTAIKAARRAGKIIMRYASQLDRLTVESKGRNDFVSQVDREAEAEIIDVIRRAYPHHAVLAEETGRQGESDYLWIVDPLDGTTNYLHGYPQYAVSIGIYHQGKPYQAVVFDPLKNDLYTASRGAGAQLNDRRMRVSGVSHFDKALLATGFPFREMRHLEVFIDTFRAILPQVSGVRRAGSAALDLAHVACGKLDGFWEFGLSAWDIAAGSLLVQEAGGLVSDFCGRPLQLESGQVLVGTPRVHAELLAVIRPHIPPDWCR
jgi:myo-inositol-1(or 4)-monophosphatase